jgi:ribose transport system substrate-binding protein
MKKIFFVLLTVAIAGAFLMGGVQTASAQKTIGFSLWTMEYTFFQSVEKGVRDACKDLGYKYIFIDQNAKADKMVNDLNSLVGQKVDGIVITPVDPGAIGPAVTKARAAKIPVVCADIGKSGPVNALLISNNFKGGQMAMDFIDKTLKAKGVKSKKVGVGTVQPQWTYARGRGDGFIARAKALGYTVASELIVQDPTAQGGYDTMQQMLSAVPDIAAVFYCSGREAVGAANAIKAAGKPIVVVGYNGDPEEIQAMRDGIMAADIAQQPYNIGYESVKLMKRIWAGEKFEDAVVPVEVALLTPDTLDKFQKDYETKMKR